MSIIPKQEKNVNKNYAFLMIDYKMPDFIKQLQNKIKEEELYLEEDCDDYGLELNTHVTLVPCLENDVDLEKVKEYLNFITNYDILLTDISKFECEKFDVLKCSVSSLALIKTNKDITNNFKTHSEYKKYKPHVTIAYMKRGMADKYLKDILPKLIYLEPVNFHFSYFDENGNQKNIKFEL